MSEAVDREEQKKLVAQAALRYLRDDAVVGVGSGSTVNAFISLLAPWARRLGGAVAASEASAERLRAVGVRVLDANSVDELPVYVDGADEVNEHLYMIKGGGGALTREKVLAAMARTFVCICDETKFVAVLGRFPLPVEVIPMARSFVARQLARRGLHPVLRERFVTDNGNLILDCHGPAIVDPPALESELNHIPGVVANGVFAHRPADVLLLAGARGVQTIARKK